MAKAVQKSGKLPATGLLEIHNLTKYFGDYAANKDIDLDINRGEIHAILGENGAGKSTLVKILYGSLQPTSGSIIWDGKQVSITDPKFAKKLGVGMVFQHFSLFDALSVAENITLSLTSDLSLNEISEQAEALANKYGLPINPRAIVGDLSVGERQRVEIVRCLMQEPELIILDEPTSVLTPQEADTLFVALRKLRDEGKSILYISHRLDEVRALCDRATILRFGEIVGKCDPSQETASSIAKMMVGDDVSDTKRIPSTQDVKYSLLEIHDLSLPAPTPFAVALENINLTIEAGEVIGIAGVAGNGQSELFSAISGETSSPSDEAIILRGFSVGKMDINERRRKGAAFVPEERIGHGAIASRKLSENLLLARHKSDSVAFRKLGPIGVIWNSMLTKATTRISEVMDVRKSGSDPYAASLSGGNLQKFIIGRELDRQPFVLVVNQPSWGVDAGAATYIRQRIIDLARTGSGILVISQDLDEIFAISDKIAVISEGKLSKPYPIDEIDREKVGLMMTSASEVDQNAA